MWNSPFLLHSIMACFIVPLESHMPGSPARTNTLDASDRLTFRVPNADHTRDVTYGKKGKHSKHHQVVSKDGQTMKVTTSGQDAQGNNTNSTEVYHKADK